ncbi:prepilin-type cleavage/methylation domain-containing protein [Chimaeribacter coloradensis]|uniref:Prepilin-type cleavage/methylation domain-containing protein n=1 Tax=Chimaeribacter coloradensis TaxID=2060068 RepID=A0A2N5DTD8_9GAMM|nr:prepilin-type N-terminal cleavage/methylation domain-containing protein [Chimaeribacter coloradensis]PLR29667.1 prepilin-type cleavage/methylation domain-containing protein [Chimaeribacter coloradensis]
MTAQRGFTLIEVLFAAMLFALSLLGLLTYQQALTAGFERQRQVQKAWRQVGDRLEAFSLTGRRSGVFPAAAGGEVTITVTAAGAPGNCRWATATAAAPAQQQVTLRRLLC